MADQFANFIRLRMSRHGEVTTIHLSTSKGRAPHGPTQIVTFTALPFGPRPGRRSGGQQRSNLLRQAGRTPKGVPVDEKRQSTGLEGDRALIRVDPLVR